MCVFSSDCVWCVAVISKFTVSYRLVQINLCCACTIPSAPTGSHLSHFFRINLPGFPTLKPVRFLFPPSPPSHRAGALPLPLLLPPARSLPLSKIPAAATRKAMLSLPQTHLCDCFFPCFFRWHRVLELRLVFARSFPSLQIRLFLTPSRCAARTYPPRRIRFLMGARNPEPFFPLLRMCFLQLINLLCPFPPVPLVLRVGLLQPFPLHAGPKRCSPPELHTS